MGCWEAPGLDEKMVTFRRDHANENCCCRCLCPTVSLGCSPLLQETLQDQQVGLVWAHMRPQLILIGLGVTRPCIQPPRVEFLLPPVLWNCQDQTPLAFKARFSGGFSSYCQIPRLGNLTWGSELSLWCENFCGVIVFQFVGHSSEYGICFYPDCAPSTTWWLLLCL